MITKYPHLQQVIKPEACRPHDAHSFILCSPQTENILMTECCLSKHQRTIFEGINLYVIRHDNTHHTSAKQ